MLSKLRIILWIEFGLAIIVLSAAAVMTILSLVQPPSLTTGYNFPYIPLLVLIFIFGIFIVYWTMKHIKHVTLKRYLLIAGVSAIAILFFQGPVHMLTEYAIIMVLFVCPIILIVGAFLALQFKANPS